MEALIEHGWLDWHVRALAVSGVVLLATAALRRATGKTRHHVLAWGLLAAVVVPTVAAFMPSTVAIEISAPTGTIMPDLSQLAAAPLAASEGAGEVAAAPAHVPWRTLALAVWLTGVAFGLLRVAVSAIGAHTLLRGAGSPGDRILDIHRALTRRTGTHARLGLTPKVCVPIVAGVSTPTILLPREATAWDEARVRAVLLHELGHVANGDHRWFPALHLMRALLWVNPLVWIACARFFREAEFAADDAAVRGGIAASSYAAELLALARIQVAPAPLLTVPALGRAEIGARIRRVLQSPSALLSLRRVVPVMLGTAGAVAVVALVQPAELIQEGPERVVAAPQGTSPGLADARGTVAIPGGSARMRLAGAYAEVVVDGAVLAKQATGPDAPQREGHLLKAIHEALDGQPDKERPVIVEAEGTLPFGTIVDALYTAGRAGFSEYRFAVDVDGAERAVDVTPPRFTVDGDQQGATSLSLMVGWTPGGTSAVVQATRDGQAKDACRLPAHREALAELMESACAASEGRPVAITFGPGATTRYASVVETMAALERSCGGATIIASGGAPSEAQHRCQSDWLE
ncbi:MAG: M56 family metallopeptidase [Myxococcota bacterium]